MPSKSARGLFRATGKKSKPIAIRDLMGEIVIADHLEREESDFYPTPPEPTRALLSVEIERLRDFVTIWEPACGNGAMTREMEAVGLDVFSSDAIDRGCPGALRQSFYAFPKFQRPCRAIVTNPPFAECNKDPGWIRHAIETLDIEYMALLLPLNWLGAIGRASLWAQYPPARVYVMRWRIDFTGQGAPPMLNCWMVWDKNWIGETVLRMLDRSDARQGEFALNTIQP